MFCCIKLKILLHYVTLCMLLQVSYQNYCYSKVTLESYYIFVLAKIYISSKDLKFHNRFYIVLEQLSVADKLNAFVIELMSEFMVILETRMLLEKNLSEAALLVRAVDRFYRRIQGNYFEIT